jgi:hypothetical protein
MVVCCKVPGGASISHDTPNECFVEGQFNIVLNRSLFDREYILINVLKALVSIISMCNFHVTFLSKITPRYLRYLQIEYFVHSVRTVNSLRSIGTDRIENTSANNYSIVASHGYRLDRVENSSSVANYGHYLATAVVYSVIS